MQRIIYIISTLFIALLVGLAGGIMDIVQPENVKEVATKLGYPLYFFSLLGVFKIAGAIALILPRSLDKIRNISYLGFTFDFIFASFSHYSVQDGVIDIAIPIIMLLILGVSFLLKSKNSLYKKNIATS